MGFAIASAATRLAEIKHHLEVSNSVFGFALACTTLGSLIGNMQAHRLVVRFGSKRIVQAFGVLMMCSVALYGSIWFIWQLAVLAFLAAFGYSTMNVAINAQGVDVEVHLNRSVMPAFHGAWSIGSLATSLLGGLVAAVIPPQWHLIAVGVFAITAMLFASQSLLPIDDVPEEIDHRAKVEGATLRLLLVTAFGLSLGAIAEGCVLDWSNIYLHEYVGISLGLNTLGLTAFLVAQISGRLLVGRLNDRFGVPRVVGLAAAAGSCGFLLSIITVRLGIANGRFELGGNSTLILSCLGFVVLGLGVSPLPAAYLSAAGRIDGLTTARGISLLALMNACFLLVLRPFISWTTDAFDVSTALMVAGLALAGSSLMARNLRHILSE